VALIAALAGIGPAAAQKPGGTLRSYIWDNPPSASIHEEATISTVFPFMPVFNNLVVFDQTKLESSLDTIVPDLALSWTWDAAKTRLTFKLAEGVKWHDGKPFTAKDVKCTFDLVAGLVDDRGLPQEPAQGLVSQRRGDHDERRPRGLLPAQAAAALLPRLLASGYSPIYPCHVSQRDMRAKPVGTGPFKVVEFKRSVSVSLARNPTTGRRACPCSIASSTG
jgi:peptide/nickel transport system substrate-binding protein